MINQTFVEASISSQMMFLPASLLLMAAILGILTRSWAGVMVTGLVIIFSIPASMGLGGWVGLPFSPPISPAPTIVLMIVVANCVHLLVALQQRLRAGDSKHDAIVESLRLNLHPVFSGQPHDGARIPEHEFLRSAALPPSRRLRRLRASAPPSCCPSRFCAALISPASHSRRQGPTAAGGPRCGAWPDFALQYRKVLFWGCVSARAGDGAWPFRAMNSTMSWCTSSMRASSFAKTRTSWTSA